MREGEPVRDGTYIKIEQKTTQQLAFLKLKLNLRNYNAVLNHLLALEKMREVNGKKG